MMKTVSFAQNSDDLMSDDLTTRSFHSIHEFSARAQIHKLLEQGSRCCFWEYTGVRVVALRDEFHKILSPLLRKKNFTVSSSIH